MAYSGPQIRNCNIVHRMSQNLTQLMHLSFVQRIKEVADTFSLGYCSEPRIVPYQKLRRLHRSDH